MTCRDDLTRVEEQSRLEQEIRANLIADATSSPSRVTEKKDDEEGIMDTLSEEQRIVYNTALEGYVNEYDLILNNRVCFLRVMPVPERVMYYD